MKRRGLPEPVAQAVAILAEEKRRGKAARKTLKRLEFREQSARNLGERLRAKDEARATQFEQDMLRAQIRRERES